MSIKDGRYTIRHITKPLEDGEPVQLIEFETDQVFGFDWSHDGKRLICVRGLWTTNVVLIKDFK